MALSRSRVGVLAVAVAALLTACGDQEPDRGTQTGNTTTTSSAADHNDQDVSFAQDMIPHHAQALGMAKMAPSRSTNPQVIDLAQRIEQAQDPEIQQMRTWLEQWGADVPPADEGDGGEHGGHDMPGMMAAEDMTALEKATGPDFDRRWLDMMIEHHQGAVTMATTELDKGGDPEARKLAQRIIDAQRAEIDEMTRLRQG